MTDAQQKLIVGGVVGLAVGGGLMAMFLLRPLGGSYEDGIRVKNGSLYIQTRGGFEFDSGKNKYKTRKTTKGCYSVAVTRGNCTGDFYADGAARVTFKSGIDGYEHVIADEGPFFGRRFHLDKGKWNLAADDTRLTYADANEFLGEVKVYDKKGVSLLSCTGTAADKMEAHLTPQGC